MLSDFPSLTETVKCTRNSCMNTNAIKSTHISIVISNGNLENLQSFLDSYFREQRTTCSMNIDGEVCNADLISSFEIDEGYFIVELINKDMSSSTSDVINDFEIYVSDVPDQLLVLGKSFNLRGMIAFYCSEKTNVSIGHYISICKRLNNFWEIYDDLEKKSKKFTKQKKFPCQCLIYTV